MGFMKTPADLGQSYRRYLTILKKFFVSKNMFSNDLLIGCVFYGHLRQVCSNATFYT